MKVEFSRETPCDWDDIANRLDGANIHQTSHWARYCQTRTMDRALFVRVLNGQKVVAQLLAFQAVPRSTVFRRGSKILAALHWFLLPLAGKVYWRGGPLVRGQDPGAVRAAIEGAVQQAKTLKAAYVEGTMPPRFPSAALQGIAGATDRRGQTIVVETAKIEDLTSVPIERSARKQIRKTLDAGVVISTYPENPAVLASHIECLKEARGDRTGATRCQVLSLAEGLKERFKIFMASSPDGQPLAGVGVMYFGCIASEGVRYATSAAYERRLSGGDRIQAEIAVWCRDQGIPLFDLAGLPSHPRDRKQDGIYRFKVKYGCPEPVAGFSQVLSRRRGALVAAMLRTVGGRNEWGF